jgi:TonB family protein
MRFSVIAVIVVWFLPFRLQASPDVMTDQEAHARHFLLSHPAPGWPRDDQRRRLPGSGVFDIQFDYASGHVREVRIVQSTGVEVLDKACIAAFKTWRAKPSTIHVLRQRITFGDPMSNHSMQPTAGRRTPKLSMTQTSHPATTRALASGG